MAFSDVIPAAVVVAGRFPRVFGLCLCTFPTFRGNTEPPDRPVHIAPPASFPSSSVCVQVNSHDVTARRLGRHGAAADAAQGCLHVNMTSLLPHLKL